MSSGGKPLDHGGDPDADRDESGHLETRGREDPEAPPRNDRDARMQQYRTSVQAVEKLTGYNFFTSVPADIRQAIDLKVDAIEPISRPRRN